MLAFTFNFIFVENSPSVGFANPDVELVNTRKAALNSAAATFGSWFTQTATLDIAVRDEHEGLLHSFGLPLIFVDNSNPGFVRTVAERKVQDGVDATGPDPDGILFLNWEEGNPNAGSARWNYTDVIGANDQDFKGEVIHNLAHILGFHSQINALGEDLFRDPLVHSLGEPGTWVNYDRFLSDAAGVALIDAEFKLDSLTWFNTSRAGGSPDAGLFFNGANAKADAVSDPAGNRNTASNSPLSIFFNQASESSRISGVVYFDGNRNNQKDPSERALGGVSVKLRGSVDGQTIQWTGITLADGTYHFDDLASGNYQVEYLTPEYMDGLGANRLDVSINAPETQADNRNFTLLGFTSYVESRLEYFTSFWYAYSPEPKHRGLRAVVGTDGAMQSFELLDDFSGVRFAEVVLSSDRESGQLTIVTDSLEVRTTALVPGKFAVFSGRAGPQFLRVIGGIDRFTFTTIDLDNPPKTTIPRFLESIRAIFAQEGWGTVAPNPASTVAPVLLVSKNGPITEPLAVTASGGTNTFNVVLNSPPVGGAVVVEVQPTNASHVQVANPASPSTLTFTTSNWNTPQTVTIQGVDDGTLVVANHETSVQVSVHASTTATNYLSALPLEVPVITIDDLGTGTIVATGASTTGAALSIGGVVQPLAPALAKVNQVAVPEFDGWRASGRHEHRASRPCASADSESGRRDGDRH